MKPFNLEEAKAGRPVCTRKGLPVRILCTDRIGGITPIIGLVKKDEVEKIYDWSDCGRFNPGVYGLHSLDLFMGEAQQ